MRCIFFDDSMCRIDAIGNFNCGTFTPTEYEVTTYCENMDFRACPRYQAFLEISKLEKE